VNRETALASSALVSLGRFDHPAGQAHRDPEEERAGFYSANFVETGRFELQAGRRRHAVAPGTLFVTTPGLTYRCRHDSEAPTDVCLSASFAPALADDVVATLGEAARAPAVVLPLTNRLAFLRLALVDAAGAGALAADTYGSELLAAVLGAETAGPPRLFRPGQLAWYAARVRAARERLEAEYAEPHSLASLARGAGMSPFHFARVFRELAGLPPHRCLLRVRLRRAAERLRQGARVTDACYDCGFSNLSHFSRSFRLAFGVVPSRYRG
jgi:AraC-like DNA-binding protein